MATTTNNCRDQANKTQRQKRMVQVAVSAAAGPGGGSGGPLAARHRNRRHATISLIKSIVFPIGCMILLCMIYVRFNRLVFGEVVGRGSSTKTKTTAVSISASSSKQELALDNTDSSSLSTTDDHVISLHPVEMTMNDVQLHYQFPPSSAPSSITSSSRINGVVLLFHGCNHDGIDWFQLPEDQAIVRYLLSKGNVVVAISSYKSYKNQGSKCWDSTYPPSENQDVHLISSVLQPSSGSTSSSSTTTKPGALLLEKLQERLPSGTSVDSIFSTSLNDRPVPVYGIGASSGGIFVTILHQTLPMNGIEIMISPGDPDAIKWIASNSPKSSSIPALRIAFVYMPKDTRFASGESINEAKQILSSSANNIQTKSFMCLPKPITAKFLSTPRIDNLSLQHARIIVTILEKNSIIDSNTGVLLVNPRRYWKKITQKLSEIDVLKNSVVNNPVVMASIEESLNLADGTHELTSAYIQEVYEFWTK